MASFDSIPIRRLEKQQVILKRDSVIITISEEDFVAKNNVLKYETTDNVKYVSTINGKSVWGTDGNIPKRQYRTIKIQIGRRSVSIPKTALENLFEPNLDYSECHYDRERDILYLSAMNSDGAGGYVVLWVIEKGRYKNKIVTNPF